MAKKSSYNRDLDRKNLERIQIILSELPSSVSDYCASRAIDTSTKTRLAIAGDLKRFFAWWHDCVPELSHNPVKNISIDDIAKITSRDIEDYITYLMSDQLNTNSKSGVARKLSSIGMYLSYLYEHDDIPANPYTKVHRPKINKDKRIIRLTPSEIQQYLKAIQDGCNGFTAQQQKYLEHTRTRDYAIAVLLLETGIRVSECVGLDISDVNFNEMQIQVFRKGEKYQILPISKHTYDALYAYWFIREKITVSDKYDEKAFFLSLQNKRMRPASVENMITKYAKAVGIQKNITPHKLRKTFGTELYHQTRDIYLVADALGHDNIVTTTKHYVDSDEDNLRKVIENLNLEDAENNTNEY